MKSELQPVPWKLHGLVLALALAFPFVFPSSFMLNFGVLALFYAFIGQSWNIAGGFAGQLSFGHVAFFGVGAYASTIVQMRLGLSPWLGLPASALAGALVGGIIAVLSFRAGLRSKCFRPSGVLNPLQSLPLPASNASIVGTARRCVHSSACRRLSRPENPR